METSGPKGTLTVRQSLISVNSENRGALVANIQQSQKEIFHITGPKDAPIVPDITTATTTLFQGAQQKLKNSVVKCILWVLEFQSM